MQITKTAASNKLPIILASASSSRRQLLEQLKIFPDQILPADIDEEPHKKERAEDLAKRLSYEKAMKVANSISEGIVIAADTVAVARNIILPKATCDEEVRFCLKNLSGRRHHIYTGLCIIKKDNSGCITRNKLVKTTVKIKRLTEKEIEIYCQLKEGINKAGGYSIRGYMECFISFISGSYSNVVGLPLLETKNILNFFNIKLTSGFM